MTTNQPIRLNRIFQPDHRAVVIALDHGIAGISPLGELANPGELLSKVVRGGADAVIVTPGILKNCGHLLRGMGVILRMDGGPTAATGNWNAMQSILEIEDAIRLGADAVIMMGIVGVEGEAESLATLGKMAARCANWGIPLVAEMLPGGFAAKEVTPEQLTVAARLGAELGAEIIKIRYLGPEEIFRQVISACYCPVLVLGGSRQAPDALLAEIRQAIDAGAAGVAIGRNVWLHPDPETMTRQIRDAVHAA
jgi:fructose-bisphosphate aldolase, class I